MTSKYFYRGQVIGRRKLDVKICACPGRDRKSEEAQCLATEIVDTPDNNSVKRKYSSECGMCSIHHMLL